MEILYVVYEWLFAILGIVLHYKIRRKESLLISMGLLLTTLSITLRFISEKFSIDSFFFSTIIPCVIFVFPLLTLLGIAMLAINWEKIIKK